MYTQQSLQDILFLMLYGGVAMLALAAGLYLGLRRSNAFVPAVIPPRALRCWTATFFVAAALSHVWWYVLGVYWLTDDRLVRNIIAVTLDHVALVPLAIALLLRMLQDRQRRLWPWVLAQVPVVVFAAVGVVRHDAFYGLDMTQYWQMGVMAIFFVYYVYALFQYDRWLRENYADLEHKEVWQSLLFMVVLFAVYETYFTNPGEMVREYMAQVNTLVIIAFLLWRVEALQQLIPESSDGVNPLSATNPNNIGAQLKKFCADEQLYLEHDLTLQQLAMAIGTNRTYLSAYFAQQGITYNTYINRLRIDHFIRLYHESIGSDGPATAMQLAQQSGFYSYSTFSAAFKKFNGQTVTVWMKDHQP